MDENDFGHGYGNYFKNSILKVTWYQLFWKFWTTTGHIDNGIWKTPYSWRFYGHGSTYVLILSWINMTKRKWAKVPWKLLVAQKFKPVLWRLLHQDISLIIFFFFFETNLVFIFNLVVIEKLSPQLVYIFTFWYPVHLGVHPVPLNFFKSKTSKIMMRLNAFL